MTEEDKELIEIYGPKIRVIRWYFENDSMVRESIKKKGGQALI